jgi:hypothetical protein
MKPTHQAVVGNLAGRDGGGLSVNWYAAPLITNCTIVGNEATGGFGVLGRTGLGGGIYSSYHSYPVILNSILWDNYALQGNELAIGTGFEYDPRPSTVDVFYSDVKGGRPFIFVDEGCTLFPPAPDWVTVGHNIQNDPCFVTGPLGDYYLSQINTNDPNQTADSPCVNTGNGLAIDVGLSSPYTTRTDEVFDTDKVDMGYHYPLAHPRDKCSFCDLSNDGEVNLADEAIFSLHWLDTNCSEANNWCGGADFTFDSRVDFEDLDLLHDCWLAQDTNAPLPNPSQWKIAPYSTPATPPFTISMTVETAFDSWGGNVEYYFECVTGNDNNSVWGPNTTYTTTGHPDPNVAYGYRVRAKDRWCIDHHYPIEMMIPGICDCNDPEDPNAPNKTLWSVIKYVVTAQEQQSVDNTPPPPVTWAVVPTATGPYSITMTSTVVDDSSTGGSNPVEYYFQCTDHGAEANSIWQQSPTYVAAGLTPSTLYTFRVRARDNVQQIPADGTGERGNKTDWSTTASATTTAEAQQNHAPVLDVPNWEVPPYETGSGDNAFVHMTAAMAEDADGDGLEYFFECDETGLRGIFSGICGPEANGYSRDWGESRQWDVCVPGGKGYHFRYKVRDVPAHAESGWSESWPAFP